MKPHNINTQIFLDSGDPAQTKKAIDHLGFLDGQTTNPSLIAKHPEAEERLKQGRLFTKTEINDFYKKIIIEIRNLIPNGPISIEVYADKSTSAEHMIADARSMFTWIPGAYIKLPTTHEGLKAAHILTKENIPVNMTLVFSQEQAAAVYSATAEAKHNVFVSPFDGRLDDINVSGMSVIENIHNMFAQSDHHVQVLAASIRDTDHVYHILNQHIDAITIPYKILKDVRLDNINKEEDTHIDNNKMLKQVAYKELDLTQPWETFDIYHELTEKGLQKFADDWNNLLKSD